MSTKIPDDILKLLDAVEEENKKRRTSLTQRVVEWNRLRNLFKFDSDQEVKMLSAAAHEFFYAKDLTERLNALADFEFIWIGTSAKYGASKYNDIPEMAKTEKDYQALYNWKESVYTIMIENIVAELSEHCPGGEDDADWIAVLLEQVLNIIVEAAEDKQVAKPRSRARKTVDREGTGERIRMAFDDWLKEIEQGG